MQQLDSLPVRSPLRAGTVHHVCNQAAFRYLLRVERSRAEQTMRPVYMVLATIGDSSVTRPLSGATASALMRGLIASVREVDLVGWYREQRVAGAVLVQSTAPPVTADAASVIADRMASGVKTRLSSSEARDLRVRLIELPR
jgi:hypothetical protein